MLILAIAIAGLAAAGVFVRQYRRNVLLMLLTLIPVGAVYKVYVSEMERLTGMDTISIVSVVNKYYMARQYNDIFPEFLTDHPEVIELMQRYHKEGDPLSVDYIVKQYFEITEIEETGMLTYPEMNDYAMSVKEKYPGLWYKYILRRIGDSIFGERSRRNICNYLVITVYTAMFFIVCIRRRHFSLVNFLTLMIGGGSLLSIFLYAQNDFVRLMLPTSPILILMGGQILNCLHLHRPRINLSGFFPKGETK